MRNTQRLNVSDIDFESIRENLKTYLQSQDALRDYDFEGSAITSIIDVLAYATHYNAVNANIGLNETFLDTAQFRGSVVGHARQLGYTPRSSVAPVAYLDVVVNDPSSQSLTIPRGHRFKTTIDNTTYEFVTDREYDTTDATFSNVKILQGRVRTAEFVYDVASSEKYTIPDVDVDTDTLRVEVYDSVNSSTFRVFTEATELTSVTEESEIYFLSENPDGLFEITFGDDVIGRALENGNLIRIEYVVTNKTAANGASIFTSIDSIQGNSNLSITTAQVARGGDEREDLDSIRYNAPLSWTSQNRAVTPQDFEAIVLENFANVDSVKAWGGEDNDPPVYGKVFLSIKPQTSELLTNQEKETILNDIVGPRSVVTVTPEIVDPQFTYVSLEVFFKYDATRTSLTENQLESSIRDRIDTFNNTDLNQFNRVFRHSSLLSIIDDTSDAVLNSTARVYLKKRFEPVLNTANQYVLDFSGPLYESRSKESIITSSTLFTVNNRTCRFKDRLNDDGTRTVQIVTGEDVNEVVVVSNAGSIQGSRIVLNNFAPTNFQGPYIEIEVLPDSNDVAPTLNNILTIDIEDLSVIGEVDTIVAGQDFSGINYNTTPRHA